MVLNLILGDEAKEGRFDAGRDGAYRYAFACRTNDRPDQLDIVDIAAEQGGHGDLGLI